MMLFPRMPLQNVPLYGAHVPLGLEKKTPRNAQTNETKDENSIAHLLCDKPNIFSMMPIIEILSFR